MQEALERRRQEMEDRRLALELSANPTPKKNALADDDEALARRLHEEEKRNYQGRRGEDSGVNAMSVYRQEEDDDYRANDMASMLAAQRMQDEEDSERVARLFQEEEDAPRFRRPDRNYRHHDYGHDDEELFDDRVPVARHGSRKRSRWHAPPPSFGRQHFGHGGGFRPEPDLSYEAMLELDETIKKPRMVPELHEIASFFTWENQEADQCSICQEDFAKDDLVATLPCLHRFHVPELDQWFDGGSTSCPICLIDVRPNV